MLAAGNSRCQPDSVYAPNMGLREQVDSYFGTQVKGLRDERNWSQEELAQRMTDCGVPMYPSTIAKIESTSKPRAVRLGEAVVIAELFDVPVSSLLGRRPDEGTLTFAMVTLMGYTRDAEEAIQRVRRTVADIEDQVEDVGNRFKSPYVKALQRDAAGMTECLGRAATLAAGLTLTATRAIAGGAKKAKL
jgi:transcriptional regulator with XRE-family HTH domain